MECANGGGAFGGRSEVAMDLDIFSVVDEEVDPNQGPVARSRANTWHGRPKLAESNAGAADGDIAPEGEVGADGTDALGSTGSGVWRKGTTRRNAWGNLSYADLITKAIESSPEKRMTLSQIYGWMVQNISFFKDKGESNSSAGWKNSIRHNLSLHNRFMRMQNEGTGKSSWWMINPDAKAVKVPRRRAATMDTKAFTGKRNRLQRAISLNTASSSSDLRIKTEEYVEQIIDPIVFSSQDYRGSSTASVVGLGVVSHMQTVQESEDAAESEFVTSSSSWNGNYATGENFDETLSESLADIFVGNLSKDGLHAPEQQSRQLLPSTQDVTPVHPGTSTQCTFVTRDCPLTYPTASHCPAFVTHNCLPGNSVALCSDSQAGRQLPVTDSNYSIDCRNTVAFVQPSDGIVHFESPIRPQVVIDSGIHLSCKSVFTTQSSETLPTKKKKVPTATLR